MHAGLPSAQEGENFYYTFHDWNLAELDLHRKAPDVLGAVKLAVVLLGVWSA